MLIFNDNIFKILLNIKVFSYKKTKLKQKKFFSILKSPHVNKSSQEQFEITIYNQKIFLYSYRVLFLIFILKYLKCKLFSDLNVKLIFNLNNTQFTTTLKTKLNPNNHNLNNDKNYVNFYMKLFNVYGKIYLTKS